MSRSRKKVPISKDHRSGKWGKKQANRAVRRDKNRSLKGKEYRKIYDSWDIHDYISFYPKEEAIKDWYAEEQEPAWNRWRHKKYKILERWLIAWEKMMYNK